MPLLPALACMMVVAFATATADIVVHSYAVGALARSEHSWGNAAQVGGAHVDLAIGTELLLVIVAQIGPSPVLFGQVLMLGGPLFEGYG